MEFRNIDPIPKELAHWIHRKRQNHDKQAKNTILWLFLSVIAKIIVKKVLGVDSGAALSADFDLSKIQPLALEVLPEGKIMLEKQIALL